MDTSIVGLIPGVKGFHRYIRKETVSAYRITENTDCEDLRKWLDGVCKESGISYAVSPFTDGEATLYNPEDEKTVIKSGDYIVVERLSNGYNLQVWSSKDFEERYCMFTEVIYDRNKENELKGIKTDSDGNNKKDLTDANDYVSI
jgi:hypothetical protein